MIGESLGLYRIDRELGSGGMGKVYAATDESGACVALKIVHPHLLETPGFFKRFLREAEVGRAIEHPNVVRTFDCDQLVVDGVANSFLVMEYVEGQTLRDLLTELERVPEELCRHIGLEVAKGLQAIHAAGIVHRDMKPENVLITEDHVVKVMDLGVARLQDEAVRLSQTGAFVGSLHYAAPESFREGGTDVDGRADLHALGLVLYELACGANPYDAADVPQVVKRVLHEEPRRLGDANPQLSPFFEEVVHCLLAKDPDERFASADELALVLEDAEDSAWWRRRASVIRAATRRPLRRIRIPRETAVYGREDELATLRALYDTAKAGEGRVLLVEGEAGVGKSRLVDELIGRLQRDGEDLNFLFGSYPPGGAATAAGGFSTAYREHFGEAGSAAYLGPTPVLVPAFDALLRGEPPPKGEEPLTKDSLQTCFVHATRSLAAERPTVVLIDDLHFAPEEGRALFTSLALAVPGHSVLLIGTTRPGVPEDWLASLTRLDQSSQMALHRLGPKDLFRLLQDTLKSEQLARDIGDQVALKSDGNPFFVFEILRGLREGQFITRQDDGTWVSTRVIDEIRIPSSVLDLVNARVAGLTEDERALLDVAACWGYEFDPGLVGEVLGLPRIPALRSFGQIERRQRLVRAAGRVMVFDHHQVQEALYASLLEQLREEYHAALAEALQKRTRAAEKDPETLDGALCVDLCEHYLRGARGEAALRYLEAAHAHLTKGYLHGQAAALGERALAVPGLLEGAERSGALLRLAGALDPLGRHERQQEAAHEAERLAAEAGEDELRCRAAGALARAFWQTSKNDEAELALRRSLEMARACGDRKAEAIATGNLGAVFLDTGRLEAARKHDERHLALSREIGDLEGEARATGNLGLVVRAQGRLGEAREHHERHLALSREIGDRQGEAQATGNLGLVARAQGRLGEAREHHERHLVLSREMGYRKGEAIAVGNLGLVFQLQGRFEEARECHEQYLTTSREIGYRLGEAIAVGNLGVVFQLQGRFEEARECHEQHLTTSREIGYRLGEAIAVGNLGSVFRARGRLEEARECHEQYLTTSREVGHRRCEAHALHDLASVHREEGDYDDCKESLLACLALCEATGYRPLAALTHLVLGSLCAERGHLDEARLTLEAARELGDDIGVAGVKVLARCELALLPGGDAEDAIAAFTGNERRLNAEERREARLLLWRATGDRAHLEEAKRLLDEAVAHVGDATRESMLTNLRVSRQIVAACKEQGL